jgi:hypothetical protein
MSKKNLSFSEEYNGEMAIATKEKLPSKMQIFHCSCNEDILIVPDIKAMSAALRNHLTRHRGQPVTEETLIQEMLKQIAERYFQLNEIDQ